MRLRSSIYRAVLSTLLDGLNAMSLGVGTWMVCMILSNPFILKSQVIPSDNSWRLFRTSDAIHDSFATAITVGYKENIWVKRGPFASASRLDGYSIKNIPSPDDSLDDSGYSNHKIHESRSGQIWSLYSGGLAEFKQERWTLYPVDLIRNQILTNMARKINLVPVDRDHTLFLMPNALYDFDAVSQKSTVLKTSDDLQIGQLNEMAESWDGHLWILGEDGIAKVEGPIRQLRSQETMVIHRWPKPWPMKNTRRLMVEDGEEVLFIADRIFEGGLIEKVGIHFDEGNWKVAFTNQEKLNYVWKNHTKGYWALSPKEIFLLNETSITGVREGQYFDVATAGNGVFFLATSKGVIRYAPPVWKPYSDSSIAKEPCLGILRNSRNEIWLSTTKGLSRMEGENILEHYPWPEFITPDPNAQHQLMELPDGRKMIGMDTEIWVFDPETGFQTFRFDDGVSGSRLLGQFEEGQVLIQVKNQVINDESSTIKPGAIRSYDGETWEEILTGDALVGLGESIFFMKRLKSNQVWLGGNRAIGMMYQDTVKVMDYRSGFPADHAYCIAETADGKLWAGAGSLLLQFDGREWIVVSRGYGKINDILAAPGNNLWVATSRGILRFREDSWVINQHQEGLPSNRVYDLELAPSGALLAATGGGLARYDPEADQDPPLCYIANPASLGRVQTQDGLVIKLTATDRWDVTPPDRILFSYRQNGGPWSSFITNNIIELTDLQAGEHHLEIRSMDRNWNIQPTPTNLKFSAFVPFYRDPQVLVLSICGFLLTLFFAWLAVNQHLKLKKSYTEVEKQVDQRTRELERANAELLQMQKMRALGTLAAGVAHDFNSILSVIKGSAQIIERNPGNTEKVQTRINRICRVVDQGTILVKAMLGISGSGKVQLEDCDINQLVNRTTHLLEDKLGPEIQFDITTSKPLPLTQGSPELIQQMLFNLLINASDAMNNKGVIQIRTRKTQFIEFETILKPSLAREYLIIEIKDTGCGISKECLSRIFEPFFTTKSFSSRKGTGLGLSMVYEFAVDMGYGLGVDSVFSKGSTFRIVIPLPDTPKLDRSTKPTP